MLFTADLCKPNTKKTKPSNTELPMTHFTPPGSPSIHHYQAPGMPPYDGNMSHDSWSLRETWIHLPQKVQVDPRRLVRAPTSVTSHPRSLPREVFRDLDLGPSEWYICTYVWDKQKRGSSTMFNPLLQIHLTTPFCSSGILPLPVSRLGHSTWDTGAERLKPAAEQNVENVPHRQDT